MDSILLDRAESFSNRIIALRRAIHAEPELGLHTPKTLAKVREDLAHLPLEWREGPSTTGAVARLKGGMEGRTVLLRGDMDALPMDEETGLDFASNIAGRMHACGHDTHTAMLAGAAHILCERQADLPGDVMFMFQPGEEGHHGARFMIEDGLLSPLPDAAFALHIMPNSPHGVIAGRSGPMMAAADQLEITVEGRGGHASMPHDTRDPVPVACEIVTALQALITRRFNAADAVVLTITQLSAGSAHNVIPDMATMKGTMRVLSAENRSALHQAIEHLAHHIAAAHDMLAKVTVTPGFPVTVNDSRAVALGESVACAAPNGAFETMDAPIMGAEDFSYVLEKVPGAMFFLGVAKDGADWRHCCGIHSSRMMVDESVLPRGTAFLAGCAEKFLTDGWGQARSR
ncbi:M20 metallopeptidase family protein [Altericroceibacterium endophyticum]|uniref:Amidohydrolase n=1 Tax=Altericroceibacterium endophyticum TaxID=1808508 RepID=A0A6I4T2S4_9SPHN|nr:M20 family metallopeptidase [Altericroceibacterium endophyticum]MXO65544.1 amidohydrolase [Altericroceibacterium endophyticum]